jgi:hypothetical protein
MQILTITLALLVFAPSSITLARVDPPPADAAPVTMPRVRPADAWAAALVLEGLRRSATLRGLIDQLEASDLIVYLETTPTLVGRVDGMLQWQAATPRNRYVRIGLNPAISGHRAIATLGHELHHAVEIANEPSIVDPASFAAFYTLHGNHVKEHNAWDTQAARDAGVTIRRELVNGRTVRIALTAEPFDPRTWHLVYGKARETT